MADKKLVYIVEDNPTWATTLSAKVQGAGYEVKQFTSGEEVLKHLKANPQEKPHIAILDYHLEGRLTGLDVLKMLKKRAQNVYAIMFTAQDSVETAVEILDRGAYDYVVKGENALERLKIILKNIEETEALEKQTVELVIRLKRTQLGIIGLVIAIFVLSFIIYLFLCPHQRAFSWDPFERGNTPDCNPNLRN